LTAKKKEEALLILGIDKLVEILRVNHFAKNSAAFSCDT